MRSDPRRPRVFIGLREVAGVGRGLKAGFDQIGVDCAFLSIGYHPYKYQTSNNPAWADRLASASAVLGRYFTGAWWKRIVWVGFLQNIFSVLALPWALLRYDAFIYLSVGSFFFFLELPILRLLGKKVVFVFLGSDSRPAYLNGAVMTSTARAAVWKTILLARMQKTIIGVIERFADVVVNIPPQAHFLTRPYANGYVIGLPVEHSAFQAPAVTADARVRILHAPSKPGPKGTARIRQIIASLRAKGLDFDYVEVTGRPHAEVLAEIQRSSFVFDELYSDTPLAGFSSEAAFFGRPAVIGSYYCHQIAQVLAPTQMPPSMFCHPDEAEQAVERLIKDRVFREDIGRRAQHFVHNDWSARRVAERYLALIDGTFPDEWLLDPREIRYLEGAALTQQRAAELVGAILSTAGPAALCLDDKPELRQLFVDMGLHAKSGASPRPLRRGECDQEVR